MELIMHVENIKAIKELTFKFPLEKGLYAITGENASGKSTLVRCASTVFFNTSLKEYFGNPPEGAYIGFELEDTTRRWEYTGKIWKQSASIKRMKINGFYEGSIIFGNRFRDATIHAINVLDNVTESELHKADDFVKENLGLILHDDKDFYATLLVMHRDSIAKRDLSGVPYFYKTNDGNLISQARMSTGENLLITILHSLNIVRKKRETTTNDGRPCIVFLDEIELALHASALRRLIHVLKEISERYNLSIFFSTHSLELIRGIKPQNIFYLTRVFDNKIIVTNPCYPAFATRNLYSDDGYGNDFVIFVEDDLAQIIVERILYEKDLLSNKRVKVLPTGGWTNTIVMARDVVASHLLTRETKILTILDRDIKPEVPDFIHKHKNCSGVKIDYLPISSLEKYLKRKLIDDFDELFFNKVNSYLFQGQPIMAILNAYNRDSDSSKDKDGKTLYGYLINELRRIRKDREDLVGLVIKYLIETDNTFLTDVTSYLEREIN